MPSHCFAPNCSHSGWGRTKCFMKRFPRDPVRAAVWEAKIRSAGRKNWVRKPWHALCECHFDKNQWENRQDGLKKLRPNAVPLIFPDSSRSRLTEEEIRSRSTHNNKIQDHLKMVHSCCAVMCYHTSNTCKLKRFPTDSKRAKVWQMNIGRIGWVRNASSYVCECHFDEEQFELNRIDGLRKLRPDAVPLVFPTHVLVVHDPLSKKKWHCPKPRPPDDWKKSVVEETEAKVEIEIDHDDHPRVSRETQNGVFSHKTDHQYSKEAEFDVGDSDDTSQMCQDFCSPSDFQEIESLAQANLDMPNPAENADFEFTGKDTYEDVETLCDIDGDSNISKSPSQHTSETNTFEEDTLENGTIAESPPEKNKTPEALKKTLILPSNTADKLPVEIVATPDIWSPFDIDSSVFSSFDVDSSSLSSQLLKDALNFLQFMLPQKWMAVSEDGGIHSFLLSRTRAKSIQRSVFVHLSGGEVELYVHAVRLPSDHDIFQFIDTIQPLTQDSLGDFVDSIINVIELFVSYKTCCGVSHRQLLKEWRKYDDCVLDSNLFGEDRYFQTVRSKKCSYFASKDGDRCKCCDSLCQRYT